MDIRLLQDELEQSIKRRETIRAENHGEVLPEDLRAEFADLTEKGKKLRKLIDIEQQKIDDGELQKQRAYLEEPVHYVPHAINADDDGRQSLQRIGWDQKNGMLLAPTSMGKMVPMYPESVLFGPISDNLEEAKYQKQTRAIFQPDYRNAYIKYIKSGGDPFAPFSDPERNALSEGSDGAGGYVVPPDIQPEVIQRRAQASVMRGLVTVRQTTRDKWGVPAIVPNTSSTANRNIYANGFVGSMVGETPSQSDVDPAFQMFWIDIKKGRAKTTLSNDWLADSIGNMIAELSASGGRALGLLEDQQVIAGANTGLETQGFLSHPQALTLVASDGMAVDVEGTTANTISNTTSLAGSAPLIKQLVYKLPSQYTQNASWLMRRAIQGAVAGLVDGNGRPFWNSYLESGFARPQMIIEGFPVYNSEFMGTDGNVSTTPATIPLAFGDFSAIYLVERTQISTRVLQERYADTDQTGLILFERFGSGLWNFDAIRLGVIAS